ncbi:hypothetical protein COU95_03410 [Candidatus Shapirobacteria bacterium CG10_big_fil_rev_8_21_14_0_10_40_9]|uniref:NlpC/P60 domain-containing protein n=1 Tax=Candidatus Shapirobacteria bacterium CG10_big_fil_rev_8_21_14_0_10_40_9 TaxID=1974888 RepID=A0A2M8L2W9_9BACT|nr:MAG: hypothetical protein COU95_03410 [Candidatus Shapirobacteria bacterium CG10_big_fil_rev_8_21_14_0_10_40_9]
MRIFRLPPKTKRLIDNYLILRIGCHKIRCPYFQNLTHRRISPVFAGKGLPEEIEKEALRFFKKQKKIVSNLSPDNIRLYMTMAGLGVDCSGFAANILYSFLQEKKLGTLWKTLKYPSLNPLRLLIYKLRPRSNISAAILSHPLNTLPINNLNRVRPGDLLKVGNHHLAIVKEVEINNKEEVIRIGYAHSTSDYLEQHGVRQGNIFLINKRRSLEKQRWDEEHRDRNWMLEDYLTAPKNQRGFRRLKVLS